MKRGAALLFLLALPAASVAQDPSAAPARRIPGLSGATPAFNDAAAPPAAEPAPAAAPAAAAPAASSQAAAAPAASPGRAPAAADSTLYVADAATSLQGATGLLRTLHAGTLRPGDIGLALSLEYMSGKDIVRVDNDARRFLGHIALAYAPNRYFEAFATLSARAVSNTLGSPQLTQSVGDLSLGGKGVYPVNDVLSLGALLRLNLPSGAESVGLSLKATGVDALGLVTADLRQAVDVPARFHLNFGLLIDNRDKLFPFTLDRVERFGQGIYDYDRFLVGLSADAPVQYVTPFVEWTTEFPLNHTCDGTVQQGCVVDLGFPSYASWLTLGARSEPVEGLSFMAAVDIGVTTSESQGTPAIPGWNLVGSIAYSLNPSGTRVVEVPVEVPVAPVDVPPALSHVLGSVVESGTNEPIAGVRIRYVGTDYTDQITGADGRFRTFDFAPGSPVTIELSHPDYVAMTMAVTIADAPVSGTITLEPAFSGVRMAGRVSGGTAPATVSFRGPSTVEATADEAGEYTIELPEPGTYDIVVSAPGARTVRERAALDAGRVQRNWSLEPQGPDDVIRWTGSTVEVGNDTRRVAFDASNGLTDDARALLDELAMALDDASSVRLLVRSHTDPKDTVEEELALTAARADAVIAYLVERGVSRSRLEPDGVGSAEPLIPNVTDRNRRQNNRMEFQILE